MPSSKGKWSKEEERMISEGSQDVSWTTQVLFYGNALTVSALPLCESWSWFDCSHTIDVVCLYHVCIMCGSGMKETSVPAV